MRGLEPLARLERHQARDALERRSLGEHALAARHEVRAGRPAGGETISAMESR